MDDGTVVHKESVSLFVETSFVMSPFSLPCFVVNTFRSITIPIGRLSPEYMGVIIGIFIYSNVKGGLRGLKI